MLVAFFVYGKVSVFVLGGGTGSDPPPNPPRCFWYAERHARRFHYSAGPADNAQGPRRQSRHAAATAHAPTTQARQPKQTNTDRAGGGRPLCALRHPRTAPKRPCVLGVVVLFCFFGGVRCVCCSFVLACFAFCAACSVCLLFSGGCCSFALAVAGRSSVVVVGSFRVSVVCCSAVGVVAGFGWAWSVFVAWFSGCCCFAWCLWCCLVFACSAVPSGSVLRLLLRWGLLPLPFFCDGGAKHGNQNRVGAVRGNSRAKSQRVNRDDDDGRIQTQINAIQTSGGSSSRSGRRIHA